jgi:hypothetical protein
MWRADDAMTMAGGVEGHWLSLVPDAVQHERSEVMHR